MLDFLKAIDIFSEYIHHGFSDDWPFYNHKHVFVVFVNPEFVDDETKNRLEELSFYPDYEDGNFFSRRFCESYAFEVWINDKNTDP